MREFLANLRLAAIAAAIVGGPYLGYWLSGAADVEEVVAASRVAGWVEVIPPIQRQASIAASSSPGGR